jgi:hypothetical protein
MAKPCFISLPGLYQELGFVEFNVDDRGLVTDLVGSAGVQLGL